MGLSVTAQALHPATSRTCLVVAAVLVHPLELTFTTVLTTPVACGGCTSLVQMWDDVWSHRLSAPDDILEGLVAVVAHSLVRWVGRGLC
jgi:hypothetical protein